MKGYFEVVKISGVTVGLMVNNAGNLNLRVTSKRGRSYVLRVWENGKIEIHIQQANGKIISCWNCYKGNFAETVQKIPVNILEIFSRIMEGIEILDVNE